MIRNCNNCGQNFERNYGKFCSRSCAATYNNSMYPKRGLGRYLPCAMCGKKRGSGKKYCSRRCQHEFAYKQFIQDWINGKNQGGTDAGVSDHIKRYLRAEQNGRCAICGLDEWRGSPIPLVCDHINGDPYDHMPDNVRLICGNCDMQLPTYKSKNKGNGRYSRRVRYMAGLSY